MFAVLFCAVACSCGRNTDIYLRAREGGYVSAVPASSNDAKASFTISVFFDKGRLATIAVPRPIKGPFILHMDQWAGKFVRVRLQAKGADARWTDIKAMDPGIDNIGKTPSTSPISHKRPNVVIYVVDALRADRLGCYNKGIQTSPNIDAFAQNSTLFKNAYAAASWTKASVASIFTGVYPPAHGAVGRGGTLDTRIPTIAEIMKHAGYHTAAFVTNGNISGEFGFAHGFDIYDYLPENQTGSEIYTSSEELLDKIEPTLRKLREPFFVYIHQSDPHAPYTPPKELAEKFIPADAEPIAGTMDVVKKLVYRALTPKPRQIKYLLGLYDGEVNAADAGFARFMEMLERRGIADKTIIVFSADHGEEFYDHNGFTHGGTLYQELVRVPLIIRCPNGSDCPKNITRPVSLVDLAPTLLDFLGIEAPESMKGLSLRAPDQPFIRPIYFHESLDKTAKEALLDWPIKLIRNINGINQWGDRVLEWEMYDLESDPLEQHPIYGKNITRRVMEENLARAHEQNKQTGPPPKSAISPELQKRLHAIGY